MSRRNLSRADYFRLTLRNRRGYGGASDGETDMQYEIVCKQPDEKSWKVTGWERRREIALLQMRKDQRQYPDQKWAVRVAKTGEIVH